MLAQSGKAPYSVLMSVYAKECPDFFWRALQSMIHQTLPPDEIVLVCDGPLTSELEAALQKLSEQNPGLIALCRLPENVGLGLALSAGLKECKNDIVARMDTDDVAAPERMAKQIDYLMMHPEISVVGCQIDEFESSITNVVSRREVPLSCGEIASRSKTRNPMNHMTVTFRKQDVLKAGGYRDFKGYEDWDLWVRMLSSGFAFANLPFVGVYARVDAGMYERRAGFAYFSQAIKLQKMMKEMGYIDSGVMLRNCFARMTGAFIPSAIRKCVYKSFLRSGACETSR